MIIRSRASKWDNLVNNVLVGSHWNKWELGWNIFKRIYDLMYILWKLPTTLRETFTFEDILIWHYIIDYVNSISLPQPQLCFTFYYKK